MLFYYWWSNILRNRTIFSWYSSAVSPGLSVSRVGSAAQSKVIRKLAGSLKLELAQFREVEDFTKLGFALDDATKRLVDRVLN